MKRHVTAGIGWGFASKCSIAAEVARGQLAIVPIEGWDCRRTFCVVHRKDFRLTQSQLAFVELAQRPELERVGGDQRRRHTSNSSSTASVGITPSCRRRRR
jgi:DNA-binding transcriptional LysR family regulator